MKRLSKLVSEKELAILAKNISRQVKQKKKQATLVFLSGNLGSGKTTFTQKVAKHFGVKERVLSPTFVFMHEHDIPELGIGNKELGRNLFNKLIHLDAYRIETKREFDSIGLKSYLNNPNNLVMIEWAEKISKWLTKPDIVLHFKHHSPKKREVRIMKNELGNKTPIHNS